MLNIKFNRIIVFCIKNFLFLYMFRKTNEKYFFFLLIIAFIHLVCFLIAVINKNIYMADFYENLQQAFNIKNFSSLYCLDFNKPIEMHFFTKRPPLYGFFVLIFKTIYNSDFSVLFAQNILSFINIFGLIKLLESFSFSFDFKKLLLLFFILLPVRFIYHNMIMSEILLQTLLFWSFYFFLLYIRENKTYQIIIYNILLALAVLTKPILLYYWISNLIFLFYLFWKRKQAIILYSVFIMPLINFFLYYCNYHTTGSYHFSNIRQMNLVGYNSAFLLVNVYGEEEGQKKMIEIRKHLNSTDNFKTFFWKKIKLD